MDTVRKLILERIDELGTNMAEVSVKIGRNHAYLQQFINRGVPQAIPEKARPALAQALGIDEDRLKVSLSGTKPVTLPGGESLVARHKNGATMSAARQTEPERIPGAQLVGERDLPVFGTAQGGKGALMLTNDVVDWVSRPDSLLRVKDGYGIIITGDSMSPEHKSGSIALVNPHLPWRNGDTCIFRSTTDEGVVTMCIKEIVRFNDETWYVKQHNPKRSFTLKRAEWQECHVTVGNYFRR